MADEKEVIEQTDAPEEIQYAKLPEPLIFRYLRERETAPSDGNPDGGWEFYVPSAEWRRIVSVLSICMMICAVLLVARFSVNAYFVSSYNAGSNDTSAEEVLLLLNFPEGYVPNYNIGNARYREENYKEAAGYFQDALRSGPSDQNGENCDIRVNLALSLLHEIDFEAMEEAIAVRDAAAAEQEQAQAAEPEEESTVEPEEEAGTEPAAGPETEAEDEPAAGSEAETEPAVEPEAAEAVDSPEVASAKRTLGKVAGQLLAARQVLCETGCADPTGTDGHDPDAEKLKQEIDELLKRVQDQDSDGGDQDDEQQQDESEEEQQKKEQSKREKKMKDQLKQQQKESNQERSDAQREKEQQEAREEEGEGGGGDDFSGKTW